MKKDKFITIRVSEEELARLNVLAGREKVGAFLLGLAFHVKRNAQGSALAYPGWSVDERYRRDGGIKISRNPTPVGMRSPVILYPEDSAYKDFV